MAKRKRGILSDLGVLIVVEAFVVALVGASPMPYPIFLALIGLSIPLAWWSFWMPTYCDFLTLKQTPCTNPVNGKMRGCKRHRRLKNDQVFAMFSLRNPGQAFRVAWGSPSSPAPASVGRGKAVNVSRRSAYDAIMLVATVGSFFTGTAGAVFTAMTL